MRVLPALLFALALVTPAQAQGVPPGGTYVGELHVDGPTWNFDGDVASGAGPFQTVTVTNTSCDVPYRPGTAQAGAIIFVAQLSVTPTDTGLVAYNGDLEPFRGSNGHGQVRVLTLDDPDVTTHIDATISNLDDFALNNTFAVCLAAGQPAGGPAPPNAGGPPAPTQDVSYPYGACLVQQVPPNAMASPSVQEAQTIPLGASQYIVARATRTSSGNWLGIYGGPQGQVVWLPVATDGSSMLLLTASCLVVPEAPAS